MNTGRILALAASLALAACGGGGSGSSASSGGTDEPVLGPPSSSLVKASAASPYGAGCGGNLGGSISYQDAEVEPYMAINPANPTNIIGVWQQDRWSDGGAHGLVAGTSLDGGQTWTESKLKMSRCAGGNATNGADYQRASDPWVTFAPDGTAYVISISFTGQTLQPGSDGAVLVVRSTDGGLTWSDAATLIRDGQSAFNDKEAITADPTDPHFVYAVWDRLTADNRGAAMFSRTTDGGATWEPARAIYDPGVDNQTIGNEIVVLQDGTLLDLFVEIDGTSGDSSTSTIKVIRSQNQGVTWTAPFTVARSLAVGTTDPNTGRGVRAGAGIPQMAAGPGGMLAVTWQDARFSNGDHDSIAYASSSDGGKHWSAPRRINSVPGAPAFTPTVAVLGDGTVGITYYDFRNDTAAATLPTDYWFTSSSDGVHWSEQHITGPFDLALAPDALGLFVGDYQALGTVSGTFVPFFVQTNDAGTANRNDAYYLPPQPHPLRVSRHVTNVAVASPEVGPGERFQRRVHENLMRLLSDEDPVWEKIREERRAPPQQP